MTMNSVFPKFSMDRNVIHWEDYLTLPTPVENHQGVWFKREDKFAPLGYGGPNGAKLRQLIWIISKNRGGKTHILSGASVKSPQLSMSTIVGAHFNLPTRLVVGATKPETILRHTNPHIAAGFGATFEYINVAYNPNLQRKVENLTRPDSLVVEYGITLDQTKHEAEQVLGFHDIGARQTTNIPDEVETVIVPAGSCNSLGSILLGLSRNPKNVKKLRTIGIGPNKMSWLRDRMEYIGMDTSSLPFEWEHYSLHDNNIFGYQDSVQESFDDIKFHPTYEAKCIRHLKNKGWIEPDGKTLFWIIGSEPKLDMIRPYFTNEELKNVR